MDEIWKQIRDTKYSVSNLGRVRNDKTARLLRTPNNSRGYPQVILYTEIREVWRVHRLVALAFIPPPDGVDACDLTVDHIVENDKENNRVDNLQWLTAVANAQKSKDAGNTPVYYSGIEHHAAKLDENTVHEVRELAIEGMSYTQIGNYFGVCSGTVSSIIRRINWTHVPEEDPCGIANLINKTVSPIGNGVDNKFAKLQEKDVIEIRKALANGESQSRIAKRFKVKPPTISDISCGRTWRHLL